ncbi:MAG: undecaprenyl-phosphate alpha-N-acetylglucosaminyl 1-phosphate transferase, partial [Gammaproteobacteria bacterium]|nr:undecaprenyl-phosphate alpha-N-acetylglucosaminyl 1-phosphate transferase [Gammaproteobacteria bacterium]
MSLYTLFSAFLMTAFALLALRPVAARVGLLDIPGGRKTHATPTPMIGGLGIYLGTLSICMLSPVIMNDYKILLALSGFVLLVGVLDDLYDIRVSLRMAMHATAAWVMADVAQVQLRSFGDIMFTGPVELGILAIPVTLFATVGVINAINMSDGLDGLSGGLSVITLILLSIVALTAGQSAVLSFSQILIVSLLAFLAFNFRLLWKKSALVYLGDAGSTLLGFIIAWLVIAATQGPSAFIAPVYALWFLAVPLMDTVRVMISRPMSGRSPFSPGRDHLHHQLMGMGFDARKTVLIIHGIAIFMGCIGLIGHFSGASEGLMFSLFMLCFFTYMVASRKVARAAPRNI